MRCLLLRGMAFSITALCLLAAQCALADDDNFPGGSPSGEIRVLGSDEDGAKGQDAVKYPEAAAAGRASDSDPAATKRRTSAEDRISGKASAAATVVERPKATSNREPAANASPQEGPPVEIEATSFKGVAPGTSTEADVAKAWGQPKKSTQINGALVQLYAVDPFKRVEVNYTKQKVSSIVIRLDRGFSVDAVTKHLDLASIRPVIVHNESGEVLGQAYPERGVLLGFEAGNQPGKPSMKVSQIVLEPLSAEPFVLRAEATLTTRRDLSRRDLEQALNIDPGCARAHWLYSKVAADQPEKAVKAASAAVRIEPANVQYRVSLAQALAQAGQLREATEEAQKAMEASEDRPHVKARATCLLGDLLASGPAPDFRKALALHTQAIQLADPLTTDSQATIRLAAKEVLIDAHLSAAHDIAWGEWKDKPKAVARWLDRAALTAKDIVNNEGGSEELLFRVYGRSLAAYVGVRGGIDPATAAQAVAASGVKLIASARDPQRKAQIEWDLGMALYDAVQICQMRSEPEAALRHGEASAKYLAEAIDVRGTPAASYLLGRLYFRMGTIHAMQNRDHKAAVEWFEKAVPLMENASPDDVAGDPGRHGEALVGMGVSYWETGHREKAVALTQQGIQWMEQAAKQGTLAESSLAVPYSNLAAMHRKLGDTDKANHFQEMASRAKIKSAN
jgi:tetratricopeptide (TPR) repeat protein